MPIEKLKSNPEVMNQIIKDGEELIGKYLTAKNIDDPAIDLLRQDKKNIQKLLVGSRTFNYSYKNTSCKRSS